jgi:hypothetical protein
MNGKANAMMAEMIERRILVNGSRKWWKSELCQGIEDIKLFFWEI